MSLKSALFSYLSTTTGVTALVGSGTACRVYPDMVPEGATTPYIRYRIISSEHVRNMTDASGFAMRRVQFDIFGTSALNVEAVFSALSNALEAKRGNIGTENLAVLSSGIETERDEYVAPVNGSQQSLSRRSVDFMIWHRL